jgi:hypothetical protein
MLKVKAVRVPKTDSGIELKLIWLWCFIGDDLPLFDVGLDPTSEVLEREFDS